ncbi:sensor histidine kinase [Kitasatospora cheerisanensis]|uniref:histidine kinase n=1 Tax=Kitasatospora cheerisanensis KCTC 2395 TaxID=1348663 RepID=A0A066Z391_9ACTN|nr:histidine kinase [Kitasatospora cheerisanensis]KDN88218.1 histidine kinase [Kitasatospora cheerisanensis KCTC 2395]
MTQAATLPGTPRPQWTGGLRAALDVRGLPTALALLALLAQLAVSRAPGEAPVAAALTVALVLPLAWRGRAPRAVFAAVAAAAFVQWLADVQLPADVALLAALHGVAARTDRRTTLIAAAVAGGGALLASMRWATGGAYLAPFLALGAAVVAAAALGTSTRTARAHLAAAREWAADVEAHHDRQARLAVAEERTRIARDLHDIVTHNLSVMVALTDAALHARQHAPGAAATAMQRAAETGRQALTDMRRALGVLHADEPDARRHPLPGLAELDTLAERMRAAGLPTRLDLRGPRDQVPATVQLTAYRLVQESLTNTLRHAAATRADVLVHCTARTVTVEITDNGTAGPAAATATGPATAGEGRGIPGMRRRAAAHGGVLEAGPLPGGGWRVRAGLRIDGSAAAPA